MAAVFVFRDFFYTISDIIIYAQAFYTAECMTCLRVIGLLLWGASHSSFLNCLLGAKSNQFPSCLTKTAFLLALNTWLSLLFITKLMSVWKTFTIKRGWGNKICWNDSYSCHCCAHFQVVRHDKQDFIASSDILNTLPAQWGLIWVWNHIK